MGGMKKTTLYLDDDVKAEPERAAREEQRSEAELVRSAIGAALDARRPPKPRLGLGESGDPGLASDLDGAMEGFGTR